MFAQEPQDVVVRAYPNHLILRDREQAAPLRPLVNAKAVHQPPNDSAARLSSKRSRLKDRVLVGADGEQEDLLEAPPPAPPPMAPEGEAQLSIGQLEIRHGEEFPEEHYGEKEVDQGMGGTD